MKTYTKKQLSKLVVPGVWVELKWDDAPNSVELVVERPDWKQAGDVDITTFCPARGSVWSHPTHHQIVAVCTYLLSRRLSTRARSDRA